MITLDNVSSGSTPSTIGVEDTNNNPDKLTGNFVQMMDISNYGFFRYAYLDSAGYVHATDRITGAPHSFNMGSELINNKVIEFTYNMSGYFIVRNNIGQARSYKDGAYGEIHENVIKVVSGRMLIQDGWGDPDNPKPVYALAGDSYIPLGANNQLDIIADGAGGTDIFLDNKIVKTQKIVKFGSSTYTLDTSGNLKKDGKVIDANVKDMGVVGQPNRVSMTIGGKNYATPVLNKLLNELSSAPYSFIIESSYLDAFKAYYQAHEPTCEWAGVAAQGVGSTGDNVPCINANQGVGSGDMLDIIWVKNDGTFSSNVEVVKADAAGFNAMYSNSKVLIFSDDIVYNNGGTASTFQPHLFTDQDTSGQPLSSFMY